MKPEEIISDEEIEIVHANANFGDSVTKRDVVREALLQTACGYHTGSTARRILIDHGLVNVPRNPDAIPTLRRKGKIYLWAAFGRLGL